MKPNKPYNNTYSNRVLRFAMDEDIRREREKKSVSPSPNAGSAKQPAAPLPTPSGDNPFIHAYAVVFGKLTPEKQAEIKAMEENNKTDSGTYNRFVCDILKEAGDVPSHDLYNHSQACGCFSCRGRK